ncbi:MAG TPA: PAS domain-containing sensor histidine kinase [Methanosarcinales archaeon]|nr:PAS domain-containing sensor histidine kinase [Methanosarcinales archaeon]
MISIVQGLGVGICVLDTDLRIRYVNDWYAHVFGDDIGKYYYVRCGYEQSIHDRISVSFEEKKPITIVQTMCGRDGRKFDATLSIMPLVDSSDKTFAAIEIVQDIVSCTDMTNRIRNILTEEQIGAPFGIYVQDDEGRLVIIDRAPIESISDLPHETELIGPPSVLFGRFEEHRESIVGISELSKVTEDLAQSNTELTDLIRGRDDVLNTVAHELRNPITAIHAYAEMLHSERFGRITEKQKNALAKIIKNSDNIAYLINDILDVSKIRSGKFTLNLEEVDITEIIDEIVGNMRSLADEKKIHLEVDLCDVPSTNVDRNQISRSVINLIDNAIKFTPESGRILVTARDTGDVIEIAVSDSGIGIAADKLTRVFEEFEQAGYQRGTGLGLAIVKKIAELHHGLLEIQSEEGKGSTFTIVLPKGDLFEN